MLANQLARRGVRHLIIDRHAGPTRQTRALGVQARTMEIYSPARHRGTRARTRQARHRREHLDGGRPKARIPLGDIGRELSPYPFLLILGQDDNERLLGEALRRQAGRCTGTPS